MSPDISSQPSSSCQQDVFVLNMAEYNQIKIKHNEIFQALTIYDCGADSSFITSSLASRLPHHFKADVTLQLKTIPGYQEFKTIQHEVEILVNGSTRRILCYECPVSIGSLQQLKGLEARLSLSLGQPINIPYGQVDLLLGLKNISLFPVDIQLQPSPVEFLDLRLYLSSTTSNHIVAGAVSRAFIRGPTLPGGQSVDKEFFTVSDMMTILMKEGDLEVAPLQCEPC